MLVGRAPRLDDVIQMSSVKSSPEIRYGASERGNSFAALLVRHGSHPVHGWPTRSLRETVARCAMIAPKLAVGTRHA